MHNITSNKGEINIRWKYSLAIFGLLLMLPMVGAITAPGNDSSGGRHLFIEVWDHQEGKIINGTAYKMMIDFPTYSLENSTLRSTVPIEIDPSELAILGQGSSLSGDVGGGAASGISSIKKVPYLLGNYSGLNISIMQIKEDNVTFDLSGRQMVLEPGESWNRESSELQQIQDSLIKVTTTLTIWNHGLVNLEWPNPGQDYQASI